MAHGASSEEKERTVSQRSPLPDPKRLRLSMYGLRKRNIDRACDKAEEIILTFPNDEKSVQKAVALLLEENRNERVKRVLTTAKESVTDGKVMKFIQETLVESSQGKKALYDDVLLDIFGRLDTYALVKVQRVCRHWRKLINDRPYFWFHLVFPRVPSVDQWSATYRGLNSIDTLCDARYKSLLLHSYRRRPYEDRDAVYELLQRINCRHLTEFDLFLQHQVFAHSAQNVLNKILLSSNCLKRLKLRVHFRFLDCVSLPDYTELNLRLTELINLDVRAVWPTDSMWHVLKAAEISIRRFEWRCGFPSDPPQLRHSREIASINAPNLENLIVLPPDNAPTDLTRFAPQLIAEVRTLIVNDAGLSLLGESLLSLISPKLEELEMDISKNSTIILEGLCRCTSLSRLTLNNKEDESGAMPLILQALAVMPSVPMQKLELNNIKRQDWVNLASMIFCRSNHACLLANLAITGQVGEDFYVILIASQVQTFILNGKMQIRPQFNGWVQQWRLPHRR